MKYSVLIFLALSMFYFSCKKDDPEVANIDEISAISYSEKIFAQPIELDNQVVAIVNDGVSTSLTSYSPYGSKNWSLNIDGYIIPLQTYEDVAQVELQKNSLGEVYLNMMQEDGQEDLIKSVKFTSYGSYLSEFSDVIHQTDTIIHQSDTLDLQGNSEFIANGIVPLSDGSTAVISSWSTGPVDTTFIQLSRYNTSGYHIGNRYFILTETVDIFQVYISASNSLILESYNNETEETRLYIVDTQNNFVNVSPAVPIFDLYSFFENSSGHFIFTASTFNSSTDYLGLVISLNSQGEYLWHKTYQANSAWLFMSVTELTGGYIFTGFDTKNILVDEFDWRTTFDTENVKGVILKTDFQGNFENNIGWSNILQIQESSVGGIVLNTGALTFFGGKYDRSIHNTIILKLDSEGQIIN